MSAVNSFLKEFLEMRKGLSKNPGEPVQAKKDPKKAVLEPKKKPKMTKEQIVEKPGLMTIVQDKPGRRVVIEYLQNRANELTEQKMA
jgi:hypothetical protein